jgi:hypothetical protein
MTMTDNTVQPDRYYHRKAFMTSRRGYDMAIMDAATENVIAYVDPDYADRITEALNAARRRLNAAPCKANNIK